METKVMTITPEMAGEWLLKNTKNRHVTKRSVERFAESMEAKEWVLNGESIKFDTQGILLDGQHRLMAIVKSGCAIESTVDFDIDPKAFTTLDTGRKRAGSDALSILGFENTQGLAAAIRVYLIYQKGRLFSDNGRANITNDQICHFATNYPALISLMQIGIQSGFINRLMGKSLAGGLYPLIYRSNPEKAVQFYYILESGDAYKYKNGATVLLLRDRLMMGAGKTSGGMRQAQISALIIHTWNHFLDGTELQVLRAPETQNLVIK